MSKPLFNEIKKFNVNIWPLFREYFTDGLFTEQNARIFLETYRRPKDGDYVIFKEIPYRFH